MSGGAGVAIRCRRIGWFQAEKTRWAMDDWGSVAGARWGSLRILSQLECVRRGA
jgi:hypothetical protein